MQFWLVSSLLLLLWVNNVRSNSSAETPGCEMNGKTLTCSNFIYSELQIEDYINTTDIEYIDFNKNIELEVDLTGVEKLTNLKGIWFMQCNQTRIRSGSSCESLRSSNLEQINIEDSDMENLDISCLPHTIKEIFVLGGGVASLNNANIDNDNLNEAYCPYLENLTSLETLYIGYNRLQAFRFKCLPNSVKLVSLPGNQITEITDLSDIPNSVRLMLTDNPIRCTCQLFRDFVYIFEERNATYINPANGQIIKCANNDNGIADYPWTLNNSTYLREYDASALGCLTSENGSDDSGDTDTDENSGKFIRTILYFITEIWKFFSRLFSNES